MTDKLHSKLLIRTVPTLLQQTFNGKQLYKTLTIGYTEVLLFIFIQQYHSTSSNHREIII